jgi:hypothetical protein
MEIEMEGMAKTAGSESGAVRRGVDMNVVHRDVL